MAEGFGQYTNSSTARVRRLKKEVEKMDVKDPEDIMMLIMDIFIRCIKFIPIYILLYCSRRIRCLLV